MTVNTSAGMALPKKKKGFFRTLGKQYQPERILIEWNGMWPQE